jgi:glycosyltransferase involved in cell wall biosynthesis
VKILHIISRLNVGGTPKYIGNLAEGLISSDIAVVVATGEVSTNEIEDSLTNECYVIKVPHLRRSISIWHDILAYFEIQCLIRNIRPDIIHTHAFKAGLLTRLSLTRIPIVHTFHGHLFSNPEFNKFQVNCIRFAEKLLAKRTEKIVTVGAQVGEDLVVMGVCQNKKIQNIPPGIHPFPLNYKKEFKFLNQNKIENDGRPIVGWLGRLTNVKNPTRVLELAASRKDLQFIVAGSGELDKIFFNHGLENLHFFEWASTMEVFDSIDVLLSTSHNEGMPILLIEATMSGIPVVANNVGAINELVVDGVNAILCSDTVESYSNGLDTMLKILNEKKSGLLESQAKAIQKFSVSALVEAHRDLYTKILYGNNHINRL